MPPPPVQQYRLLIGKVPGMVQDVKEPCLSHPLDLKVNELCGIRAQYSFRGTQLTCYTVDVATAPTTMLWAPLLLVLVLSLRRLDSGWLVETTL